MDKARRASLVTYLMEEGQNVGRCARDGWDCARNIMNYYDSVCVETTQSRDREWELLEKSIDEYKKRKAGVINENVI